MKKTLIQKFENEARTELEGTNFKGNLNPYFVQGKEVFKAQTSLINKSIHIGFNPSYAKKVGEEPVLRFAKDGTSHEINHHKYETSKFQCIGCPQDKEKDYNLFFLPAYEILAPKGFSKTDIDYVTNALEDLILHKDLSKNTYKKLDGIVDFFEGAGETSQNKKFSDFYEAHVRLNMKQWGDKKQKKKLRKYFPNNTKLRQAVNTFLTEIKDLRLLDETNWQQITKIYCETFYPFMTQGFALPLMNHNGAGTQGREYEDSSEEGNVFQKQRETEEFKRGEVIKAHKKEEKAPNWIDNVEAMRLLYESLAQEMVIKAESYTNPEQMPITWFGSRTFDPQHDSHSNLTFGFNDQTEVELKKRKYFISKEIRIKTSPKSFPQIKFGIYDISASMQEDLNGKSNIGNTNIIRWGDNSKYHWLCFTAFEIMEYFRKNHLLEQNKISGAFFGENTTLVNGLSGLVNKLLTPSFESDTKLDFQKIQNFFEGYDNLLYTASDGEWRNWNSIKNSFIKGAKRHSYVHLHLGTPNSMTAELKRHGLFVVYGEDGKGITQKVIDLTDRLVRN